MKTSLLIFVLRLLSFGGTAAFCLNSVAAAVADRPNVILILADDIGIGGFHCYGGDKYQTPHIDALAGGGLRFEHCYAMPICGPSRATLLTGRYPFRLISRAPAGVAPDKEVCIARVLSQAGYATAYGGKWQLAGG